MDKNILDLLLSNKRFDKGLNGDPTHYQVDQHIHSVLSKKNIENVDFVFNSYNKQYLFGINIDTIIVELYKIDIEYISNLYRNVTQDKHKYYIVDNTCGNDIVNGCSYEAFKPKDQEELKKAFLSNLKINVGRLFTYNTYYLAVYNSLWYLMSPNEFQQVKDHSIQNQKNQDLLVITNLLNSLK